MRKTTCVGAMAVLLSAATAGAAPWRGTGTGRSAATAPVTKSDETPGEAARLPTRDLAIEPRHGLFGAPGAALDGEGPSRLGPHAERAQRPSYGEGAQASAQIPDTWRSGDRVRSLSSGDVRSARQQQAPDLEWAGGGPGAPQLQPQEPYGIRVQQPGAVRRQDRR